MCLFIKEGCHIEIAKEDIVTFKNVLPRGNRWEPVIRGLELYEFNKVLTARKFPYTPEDAIEHLKVVNESEIYEGFHSRISWEPCYDTICIIPKGTEICYGTDNEIVSLHIIVFKNKLSYLKYRLAKLFKKAVHYTFNVGVLGSNPRGVTANRIMQFCKTSIILV